MYVCMYVCIYVCMCILNQTKKQNPPSDPLAEVITNMNILDQKTTELSRFGKEPFSPDKVKLPCNNDKDETCSQCVEDSLYPSV